MGADTIMTFESLRQSLIDDESNAEMRQQGWQPVYIAAATARIAVIGQAPGRRAQESGVPWDDASGSALMSWLGVSEEQFRDPALFAAIPMDFYFPGRGKGGDLPPRKGFADRWHPPLFALMPDIQLTLLIGRYAQQLYLPDARRNTLTVTVRDFERFLPQRFPLVHPSPLNFRWHAANPWFIDEVVPRLRSQVESVLHRPQGGASTGRGLHSQAGSCLGADDPHEAHHEVVGTLGESDAQARSGERPGGQ